VRTLTIAIALLAATAAFAGQATYTSPDGVFQFTYPDSFRLYAGDQIGDGSSPACSPPPVVNGEACVRYQNDKYKRTTFNDAAFLVNTVPEASNEADCLSFKDWQAEERVKTSYATINGVQFSKASMVGVMRAYSNQEHLYRAFHGKQCYELSITIGYALYSDDDKLKTFTADDAKKVRAALEPVLQSFRFLK
jgi:hypothetical protein